MMSNDKRSIERLCELLDERNVEYGWDTNSVYWDGNDGVPWTADLYLGNNLSLFSPRCTPEQAIKATLGVGTCHITVQDNLAETEGMGDVWLECDTCHWQMLLEPSTPRFKFCPNCGRKVVN
jgi:hypothetical protein